MICAAGRLVAWLGEFLLAVMIAAMLAWLVLNGYRSED